MPSPDIFFLMLNLPCRPRFSSFRSRELCIHRQVLDMDRKPTKALSTGHIEDWTRVLFCKLPEWRLRD